MKSSFLWRTRHTVARWSCALGCVAMASGALAAGLTDAQLTRIIKDVNLLPAQAVPRPAAINDSVHKGTGVSTGVDSRAELTFADRTLTRLGSNTIFSFNEGTRDLDLGGGVILLHVPKDSGGAKITTSSVTAAVTGTTLVMEFHKEAVSKMFVLEGLVRMALRSHPDEWVPVHAGEMLTIDPKAERLDAPGVFDIASFMATSVLVTDFSSLDSAPLIAQAIQQQTQQKANGQLIGPSVVVYGAGDGVTLKDPPPLDVLDQRINAILPVTLATGEFGPLKTITSPDPYVIGSNTTIMTAPTITTNGVKGQGKIYRGSARDGTPSQYYFGSTNPFDTASNFNTKFDSDNTVPSAAFKFNSLQLTGDPIVKIPKGGATNLSLITVFDISSGGPGGTITFGGGIKTVLFATQLDTPINLGNNLTFTGLDQLSFYCRGGSITMGATISNVSTVQLFARGMVRVDGPEDVFKFESFVGSDFVAGAGHIIAHVIQIDSLGDLHFDGNQFAVGAGFSTDVHLDAAFALTIDASNTTALANATNLFARGDGLTITGGTTLNFNSTASVQFISGAADLEASTITFNHPGQLLEMSSVNGNINAMGIVGGDVIQSQLGAINVSNVLNAVTVIAGGDITAGHVEVQTINPGVTSSNTILTAGAGGITPFLGSTSAPPPVFNVSTVHSPTGIDFSGANFPAASSSGGQLTINADAQAFDASGIKGANFNGADAPNAGAAAGGGGTFTVNTVNNLSVDTNISATSGIIGSFDQPSGAGGNVTLSSAKGQVSVGASGAATVIKVSSGDATGLSNRRSSTSGGSISVSSAAPAITAINISSSAQLLSLLDAAAPPGPGGKIIISATGSTSGVNVQGTLQADHGAVDVRQTNSGVVTVNGATLRGDIVKVAALGANGTLFIGKSVISADTILKLYANGSNGLIDFTDNVTLNGTSVKTIAADTVTIDNGKVVTVNGPPADVFVNFNGMVPKANYTGSGGNGSTTGSFSPNGAKNPQPLGNAPPLGAVGGP